ncbi:DUF3455 domain-containing protein [Pendulispora brunnea]|uniref:DUF3455 domain-containing protein n=1 Tax=Pendulispora brunnea TaxID=2905690 RepID=A0ABZ2JY80_9BACT
MMPIRRLRATDSPAALALMLGLLSCRPSAEKAPTVPPAIAVPDGAVVSLKVHAVGVQRYMCKTPPEGNASFAWTLVAPEADLFDAAGKRIGKHYAGPTWEDLAGTKVVAEVKAKTDSPDPNAIPWLLLQAKSHEGTGSLGHAKFIHRIATSGGKAPEGGCDEASVGFEKRIPYNADYYFYDAANGT